jgi:hypothetical protein
VAVLAERGWEGGGIRRVNEPAIDFTVRNYSLAAIRRESTEESQVLLSVSASCVCANARI